MAMGGTVFLDPVFQVRRTNDILYGTGDLGNPTSGQMDLLLDLYQPVGEDLPGKLPGLVFIHGGGFVGGDKGVAQAVRFCETYASRGYVAVSINYRLTGDDPSAEPGPTPNLDARQRAINAAAQDAAKAVRWMRAKADACNIDPNRIAVGGSSAGGYTALFTGYQESDTLGPGAEVAVILDLWGGMFGTESLIDPDDPPVFIVHGTADPTVPITEAYNLRDRLGELNIPYGWYLDEGGGHAVWNYFWNDLVDDKTIERLCAEFFFTHLDLIQIHPAAVLPSRTIELQPDAQGFVWSVPTDRSFIYQVESSWEMQSWGESGIPPFQGTGSLVELDLPADRGNFHRIILSPGF